MSILCAKKTRPGIESGFASFVLTAAYSFSAAWFERVGSSGETADRRGKLCLLYTSDAADEAGMV